MQLKTADRIRNTVRSYIPGTYIHEKRLHSTHTRDKKQDRVGNAERNHGRNADCSTAAPLYFLPQRGDPTACCCCSWVAFPSLNPFRTAVPFWGQTSQNSSIFVPKRDRGSKGVKNAPVVQVVTLEFSFFCLSPGFEPQVDRTFI